MAFMRGRSSCLNLHSWQNLYRQSTSVLNTYGSAYDIHGCRRDTENVCPDRGQFQQRFFSSNQIPVNEGQSRSDGKLVLYRTKWIRPVRLLVRMKLFQLGGVMFLAVPLAEYSQQGSLSLGTTLAVVAVVGGAGAASVALWYYSRRFIGELALVSPDLRKVQLSVLDFWGNREDLQYDIRDVVPPLKGMTKEELEVVAKQSLMPLDVVGHRQFFLSLRHGFLLNQEILFSILNGSFEIDDNHSFPSTGQNVESQQT